MEKINGRLLNWASILEDNTREQALRTAAMPFVYPHLALMPDAHLGKGATVGSVIPTDGTIIPSGSNTPIKAWTVGVPLEDAAKAQLEKTARLPFVHKWIAVMPDAHQGIGATVGSVIATHGAVVPAAVGVDIGCGMMAARTSLSAKDLPDSLAGLRSAIEAKVPHGRTDNGGKNDRGAW
ncbi:MAG: RtcB family protein, partial [Blastococcus sp.]